jgi:hypothetical protein
MFRLFFLGLLTLLYTVAQAANPVVPVDLTVPKVVGTSVVTNIVIREVPIITPIKRFSMVCNSEWVCVSTYIDNSK